jgi:outer membrane protein assembly factor BamB
MSLRTGTALGTSLALAGLTALAALALPAKPGDWPQWRGPDRNGVSRETGLLKSWPAEGPKLVWKAEGLGGGYSTPSVAGGRLYGMGYRGDDEAVWARDARTGSELWATVINKANRQIGYNEGSRCTPTVDGSLVYAEGTSGDVVCLNAADGKLRWQKNLVQDFGGKVPGWGYSESPLVDMDKVVVTPGGATTLVALNKMTGEPVWKTQVPGVDVHYSSAIAADVDGQRQYIQLLRGGLIGVAANDGHFLWKYDKPSNGTATIPTAIYSDHYVFAASGYGTGGGLVKLTTNPDKTVTATEVYFTKSMKNHHGGVILVGDSLYGFDDPSTLTCLDFKTGAVKWTNRSVGKGSLVYADGNLYARSQDGPVALVEANPEAYVEKGRFVQPDRSSKMAWPHPVVAGGRLYLRDQDVLFCYDVKGTR